MDSLKSARQLVDILEGVGMGHASTLFNGAVDQTLIKRITPTTEQRDFLQEQWNLLAEFLKTDLNDKTGYPISTWLQGSYKYGTLIKPVHFDEEYDVDVGIYFNHTEEDGIEPSPSDLKDWVQQSLLDYKFTNSDVKEVEIPSKERCSRAIYLRQFHIDTPVYLLDPSKDKRKLACNSGHWEFSDPKSIYKWFRNAIYDPENREQLRRLIRYLKAWAAVSFENAPTSRPSSILLTVVATEAYRDMWLSRILGRDDDDDALIHLIRDIHTRLFKDRDVFNPIDDKESLNRMSSEDWEGFLPRLDALLDIAMAAGEQEDEVSAALAWSEAFSFLMPLPETEVEVIDDASGRAVMVLPEVEIKVFAPKNDSPIAIYQNEVPTVKKFHTLQFRIINPHILPDYASIEWTVRNEGDDADKRSDMGHSSIGLRKIENEENTAYIGRHYMDCVVRANNQIYAVRRVPVNVVESAVPLLQQKARPAYTKIASLKRRRRSTRN